MATLLVVDDDRAARRTLQLAFGQQGHDVVTAGTGREGMELWRGKRPDVVLLDLMLPDANGIDLLQQSKEEDLPGMVIMITGHQDLDRAITAMRAGAFDYIHKPLNFDELEIAVQRALTMNEERRKIALVADLAGERHDEAIVGHSRAIVNLHKQIGMASRGRANVLVTGESGTGKELVARAIHRFTNPETPFIPVNCSAFVSTLLESELFGHEKGAFTGADRRKPGRLELAGEGTLFLDEIGDMDLSLQAKLLRVLQERVYERVGGTENLPFKSRVIAATHRDLAEMIGGGEFREDLYYRLKVVEIHLPPLRDRREDIPPLVEHLLVRANRNLRREVTEVPEEVMTRLTEYDWPGNVRELENRIIAGVMISPGNTLQVELPRDTGSERGNAKEVPVATWDRSLTDVEREHIERVLRATGGHLGKACEILGISRPTLRKKIEDYGLKQSSNS